MMNYTAVLIDDEVHLLKAWLFCWIKPGYLFR